MAKLNALIETQAISYAVQNQDLGMFKRNKIEPQDLEGNNSKILQFLLESEAEYGTSPSEMAVLTKFPDEYTPLRVTDAPRYVEEELVSYVGVKKFSGAFNGKLSTLLSGNGYQRRDTLQTLVSEAQEILDEMSFTNDGEGSYNLTDGTSRLEKWKDKRKEGRVPPIYLGIETLDMEMGGLLDDDILVIAARPSHGKSMVATMFAENIYQQGKSVLMYSGEMDESQVGYRFDTFATGVSNKALQFGKYLPQEDIDKLSKFYEEAAQKENKVTLVDQTKFNGMPTWEDIAKEMDECNPDVVIIDQLSLMRDSLRGRDEKVRYTNIMRGIRNLAIKKKTPFIVLAQANRTATEKDSEGAYMLPTQNQIAESDSVTQFATRIITIVRNKLDDHTYQVKLGLEKDRFGGSAEINLIADWDKGEVVVSHANSGSSEAPVQGGQVTLDIPVTF